MPRADHNTESVSEARGRKSVPLAITVNVTATLLAPLDAKRVSFLLHNTESKGAVAIYIGSDATVTAATGVPIDGGVTFEDITSYDEWWGIVAQGSVDARIIITTLDA